METQGETPHPATSEVLRRCDALFHHSLEPIVFHSGERVLDGNPAAVALLGGTCREEFIGRPIFDFIHPEDHPRVRRRIRRMRETGRPAAAEEIRLVGLDDRVVYVEILTVPVSDGEERLFQVAMRDITARKQAEEALVRSESFWRALIEHAADGILVVHFDGKIIEVNSRMCAMTGRTRGELLDLSLDRLMADRVEGDHIRLWRRIRHGQTVRLERLLRRSKGAPLPVEVSVGLVDAGIVQIIVRDVSERIRTQRALHESEEKFRNLVERSPACIYIIQDDRFVYVNPAFANALQCTQDEITALPDVLPVLAEDDRPLVRDAIHRHLAGENPGTLSRIRARRKDGQTIDLDVTGTVTDYRGRPAIIGTALDVTDRRRAEEALRKSEHRYRSLMEQASDAIFLADPDTGMLVDANAGAIELTGYSLEELRTMHQTALHPPEDRERCMQLFENRPVGEPFRCDVRVQHRDGRRIPVGISASVVDVGGRVLLQGIFRDETEQQRYLAQLVRAREKARELNRLKSVFLANMSHEIRTPLTSIIGFAEILAEEVAPTHREFATLIHSSGRRLLETLNSVLDLAQLESRSLRLNPQPVDLEAVLRESVEMFSHQARSRGLSLQLVLPSELPPVSLDRAALDRVLGNLISNALKFTPQGSVTVSAEAASGSLIIRVADTGIGMSPSFLPKVFDEFRQESNGIGRAYEGSGLGMAITRRLVELMRGTISVSSEQGQGSVFEVVLPGAGVVSAPAATSDAVPVEAPVTHLSVLVVERDGDTRALLRRYLSPACEVIMATGLTDALDLAAALPVDVVLLDLDQGDGGDGVEILTALRRLPACATVPVVAVTTRALPGDRENVLGLGFDDYVAKPFTRHVLTAALARAAACIVRHEQS